MDQITVLNSEIIGVARATWGVIPLFILIKQGGGYTLAQCWSWMTLELYVATNSTHSCYIHTAAERLEKFTTGRETSSANGQPEQ